MSHLPNDSGAGLSFVSMNVALDKLSLFTDKNLQAFKDLSSYFKKRYSLEEEFFRHLHKSTRATSQQCRESAENGGSDIVGNCEEILAVAANLAQAQHVAVAGLVEKVQEPSKELEAQVKKCKADKEKSVKHLKATYAVQAKVRAKYALLFGEYNLAVQQNMPADKCEQLKKKLGVVKAEDREATLASNKAQEHFYRHELPEILKKLRELNQLIVIFLEGLIKDYYNLVVQGVPASQQCMADTSVWVAKSDYRNSMVLVTKLEGDESFALPPALALLEELEEGNSTGEEISRQSMDVSASAVRPSDIDSVHCGWLSKHDEATKTWKKKWGVLGTDFSLYLFKSPDGDISGRVDMGTHSIEEAKEYKQAHAFKLVHQTLRPHLLAAENDQDLATWVKLLVSATAGKYPEPNPRSPPAMGLLSPRSPPPVSQKPQSVPPPGMAARAGKPAPMPKPKAVPPPRIAGEPMVAQYDCTPTYPDELAFEEGDTLYILDKSDPNWWKAKTKTGKEGVVPSNYF